MTGIPAINGEDVQVLRYEFMQRYREHYDYFDKSYLTAGDGMQRIGTILLYLSDVEKGGETHFPRGVVAKEFQEAHKNDGEKLSSTCGPPDHLAYVKAKKRDALFFYSMDVPFLKEDPMSLHEGCPVTKGTKWSATIWMHQGPFRKDSLRVRGCADDNKNCKDWASRGECSKNPKYMKKSCRLSCNVCTECLPGDVLCERKNVEIDL